MNDFIKEGLRKMGEGRGDQFTVQLVSIHRRAYFRIQKKCNEIYLRELPLGSQNHSRISYLCVCARVPFALQTVCEFSELKRVESEDFGSDSRCNFAL